MAQNNELNFKTRKDLIPETGSLVGQKNELVLKVKTKDEDLLDQLQKGSIPSDDKISNASISQLQKAIQGVESEEDKDKKF